MCEDPQLEGPHKKSLMTTESRRVGDCVGGYFGDYKSRAPSGRTKQQQSLPERLDTIHLRNVPGSSVFACFYCHTVAVNSFWFALQGSRGKNTSLRIHGVRPAMPTIRRRPKTPSTFSPTAPSRKILQFPSTKKTEFLCSASVTSMQVRKTRLLSGYTTMRLNTLTPRKRKKKKQMASRPP